MYSSGITASQPKTACEGSLKGTYSSSICTDIGRVGRCGLGFTEASGGGWESLATYTDTPGNERQRRADCY